MVTRIIRPVPNPGLELAPSGTILVDGYMDYLTVDSTVPIDSVYVAEMDETTKEIIVVKDETVGKNIQAHTFSGWPVTEGGINRTPPEEVIL